MPSDPFGRAIRDRYREEATEPLVQRDGEERLEHPVEAFYLGDHDPDHPKWDWADRHLNGPLLELGAGAGREALYYQERFEVVAIEASEALVEVMTERGVRDARRADMFALRDAFGRDRFVSALAHGTQLGLVRSMAGLRRFLADLAHVTTPEATAVVDNYDPDAAGVEDLLGYRTDPSPGLAFRVMSFEYEDDHGPILLFRLFGPDRLREATVGTEWDVVDVNRPNEDEIYYLAALAKR